MSEGDDVHARVGRTVAGKYRLVRVLGSGGMGAVYEAVHSYTGRSVALKLMHDRISTSAGAVARFVRESRAPAAIGHSGIVQVLDGGQDTDGRPYLALELLDGEDLESTLTSGPAAVGDVVKIALKVLDVLAVAHARGFVHRDIKPENIFLVRSAGEQPDVKLLDFGVAGRLAHVEGSPVLTASGAVLGTLHYMSPEQARGERVDARADLWALGGSIFRALTRAYAFPADNYNLGIIAIVTGTAPPVASLRADIPPRVAAIVDRSMQKDIALRFQSAAEMSAALRASLDLPEPASRESSEPVAASEAVAVGPRTEPAENAAIVDSAAIGPTLLAAPFATSQERARADSELEEAIGGILGRPSVPARRWLLGVVVAVLAIGSATLALRSHEPAAQSPVLARSARTAAAPRARTVPNALPVAAIVSHAAPAPPVALERAVEPAPQVPLARPSTAPTPVVTPTSPPRVRPTVVRPTVAEREAVRPREASPAPVAPAPAPVVPTPPAETAPNAPRHAPVRTYN